MKWSFGAWVTLLCGLFVAPPGSMVRADEVPNGKRIAAAEPEKESTAKSPGEEPADPLMGVVEEAISTTSRRFLDVDSHTPWQIMHGVLALRTDFQLRQKGKLINAYDYLASNPRFQGEPWFQKTPYGGRAHPFTTAYAFEGHPNQFFAIMCMSDIGMDHVFQTDNGPITVADMVRNAQMDVNDREEVAWTLWSLSLCIEPDATWVNKNGEQWSMERLVQIQSRANIYNAACGGTHGMFGLAHARNSYLQTGRPLRGVWLEADQKIRRHVEEARTYQNRDGTLSTNYFRGPGSSNDVHKRLPGEGHVLEFLMVALPQNRLQEQWVRNAIYTVSRDLIDHKKEPLECGAMYHALDALILYRDRMKPAPAAEVVESKPVPTEEPKKGPETVTVLKPAVEHVGPVDAPKPDAEESTEDALAAPVEPAPMPTGAEAGGAVPGPALEVGK